MSRGQNVAPASPLVGDGNSKTPNGPANSIAPNLQKSIQNLLARLGDIRNSLNQTTTSLQSTVPNSIQKLRRPSSARDSSTDSDLSDSWGSDVPDDYSYTPKNPSKNASTKQASTASSPSPYKASGPVGSPKTKRHSTPTKLTSVPVSTPSAPLDNGEVSDIDNDDIPEGPLMLVTEKDKYKSITNETGDESPAPDDLDDLDDLQGFSDMEEPISENKSSCDSSLLDTKISPNSQSSSSPHSILGNANAMMSFPSRCLEERNNLDAIEAWVKNLKTAPDATLSKLSSKISDILREMYSPPKAHSSSKVVSTGFDEEMNSRPPRARSAFEGRNGDYDSNNNRALSSDGESGFDSDDMGDMDETASGTDFHAMDTDMCTLNVPSGVVFVDGTWKTINDATDDTIDALLGLDDFGAFHSDTDGELDFEQPSDESEQDVDGGLAATDDTASASANSSTNHITPLTSSGSLPPSAILGPSLFEAARSRMNKKNLQTINRNDLSTFIAFEDGVMSAPVRKSSLALIKPGANTDVTSTLVKPKRSENYPDTLDDIDDDEEDGDLDELDGFDDDDDAKLPIRNNATASSSKPELDGDVIEGIDDLDDLDEDLTAATLAKNSQKTTSSSTAGLDLKNTPLNLYTASSDGQTLSHSPPHTPNGSRTSGTALTVKTHGTPKTPRKSKITPRSLAISTTSSFTHAAGQGQDGSDALVMGSLASSGSLSFAGSHSTSRVVNSKNSATTSPEDDDAECEGEGEGEREDSRNAFGDDSIGFSDEELEQSQSLGKIQSHNHDIISGSIGGEEDGEECLDEDEGHDRLYSVDSDPPSVIRSKTQALSSTTSTNGHNSPALLSIPGRFSTSPSPMATQPGACGSTNPGGKTLRRKSARGEKDMPHGIAHMSSRDRRAKRSVVEYPLDLDTALKEVDSASHQTPSLLESKGSKQGSSQSWSVMSTPSAGSVSASASIASTPASPDSGSRSVSAMNNLFDEDDMLDFLDDDNDDINLDDIKNNPVIATKAAALAAAEGEKKELFEFALPPSLLRVFNNTEKEHADLFGHASSSKPTAVSSRNSTLRPPTGNHVSLGMQSIQRMLQSDIKLDWALHIGKIYEQDGVPGMGGDQYYAQV